MAVLKIVPKLYQEKIPETLKEEISLVTTGEAKYYNRLYKFFQYTDIQCTADINYETRKMYMDSLEKEDISEKYKAELLSLFDRLKIENMPDVYSQGKPFSVEQEFFKQAACREWQETGCSIKRRLFSCLTCRIRNWSKILNMFRISRNWCGILQRERRRN